MYLQPVTIQILLQILRGPLVTFKLKFQQICRGLRPFWPGPCFSLSRLQSSFLRSLNRADSLPIQVLYLLFTFWKHCLRCLHGFFRFVFDASLKYNSPMIMIKVNSVMVFSIFTELCNHHHNLVSECFHHAGRHFHSPASFSSFGQPLICTLSLQIWQFRTFYINETIKIYGVAVFFHLVCCFCSLSMLPQYSTFCLSIHQLIEICVVFTFWLLWRYFHEHSCTSLCVTFSFLG